MKLLTCSYRFSTDNGFYSVIFLGLADRGLRSGKNYIIIGPNGDTAGKGKTTLLANKTTATHLMVTLFTEQKLKQLKSITNE